MLEWTKTDHGYKATIPGCPDRTIEVQRNPSRRWNLFLDGVKQATRPTTLTLAKQLAEEVAANESEKNPPGWNGVDDLPDLQRLADDGNPHEDPPEPSDPTAAPNAEPSSPPSTDLDIHQPFVAEGTETYHGEGEESSDPDLRPGSESEGVGAAGGTPVNVRAPLVNAEDSDLCCEDLNCRKCFGSGQVPVEPPENDEDGDPILEPTPLVPVEPEPPTPQPVPRKAARTRPDEYHELGDPGAFLRRGIPVRPDGTPVLSWLAG